MMTKVRYEMLVAGSSYEQASQRALRFFSRYELVRFDAVHISREKSVPGSSLEFFSRLAAGVAANRRVLEQLLDELKKEGVAALTDLSGLPQGYRSKMLHTVAHFLDGFFGVDSFFYSLEEDSHWVSDDLREKIVAAPGSFWLLEAEAVFTGVSADLTGFIRSGKM